jgi:hypothetical protein
MLPYQQRVVDEKAELDGKAHLLAAFIAAPPVPVPADEIGRLTTQLAIMDAYSAILTARIDAF